MIAFAGDFDVVAPPQQADVDHAILQWFLLAICYHTLIVLLSGGLKDLCEHGIAWFKVTVTTRTVCHPGGNESSRISRYYKCQKRARRQGRGPDPNCFLQCALAKLQMPAPLPYRRRRGADAESAAEGGKVDADKEDSCDKSITVTEQISEASFNSVDTTSKACPTEQQPVAHVVKPKKHRKSRKSSSMAQTPLIDVARMQHWSLLLQRASEYKREARYTDADGLLPLHWAVSGGPPTEVVDALLKAYPKGASAVDTEGSNALHFACHYGASVDVVQLLLSVNGKAIQQLDKHGRSPLYHAVDKRANLDILRTLVQADPSMITTPCLPQDEELAKKVRARDNRPLEHRTPLFMLWANVVLDSPSREKREGRLWEKADLLLRAAYTYHSSQRIYRMVHASVTLDCYLPPHVLAIAIDQFPEQLAEKEEPTGRVPLAIAAAQDQLCMQRSHDVIRTLISAYPEAARISDRRHQMPLALAAGSGKAWTAGVEDIFLAAPDLINWRDGWKMTYPALLSASSEPAKETESVMQGRRIYATFPLKENTKTKDWMAQAKSSTRNEEGSGLWQTIPSEARHLSTVFELLLADPSLMK